MIRGYNYQQIVVEMYNFRCSASLGIRKVSKQESYCECNRVSGVVRCTQ